MKVVPIPKEALPLKTASAPIIASFNIFYTSTNCPEIVSWGFAAKTAVCVLALVGTAYTEPLAAAIGISLGCVLLLIDFGEAAYFPKLQRQGIPADQIDNSCSTNRATFQISKMPNSCVRNLNKKALDARETEKDIEKALVFKATDEYPDITLTEECECRLKNARIEIDIVFCGNSNITLVG